MLQKKVFLKISEISEENTCVGVSFLIKLQGFRPATFLKGDSNTYFLEKFTKFSKAPFLKNICAKLHLQANTATCQKKYLFLCWMLRFIIQYNYFNIFQQFGTNVVMLQLLTTSALAFSDWAFTGLNSLTWPIECHSFFQRCRSKLSCFSNFDLKEMQLKNIVPPELSGKMS